jgi:hypothetical protein
VVYLVNLLGIPQDPDAALNNNKVLPEQGGSPLTSLLLLAARNTEEEEEGENCCGPSSSYMLININSIYLNFLQSYSVHCSISHLTNSLFLIARYCLSF